MLIVHRLAWQNHEGSLLRAFPSLPDDGFVGKPEWPPHVVVTIPKGRHPRAVCRIDAAIPPDCFSSTLGIGPGQGTCPTVAECSIEAINLILAALKHFTLAAPPPPPGPSGKIEQTQAPQ